MEELEVWRRIATAPEGDWSWEDRRGGVPTFPPLDDGDRSLPLAPTTSVPKYESECYY